MHGDLCMQLGIDSSTDRIPVFRLVLESIPIWGGGGGGGGAQVA